MSDIISEYIIKKRTGWFNGPYTHQVFSNKLEKIICISNEGGCEVVAHALNSFNSMHERLNKLL